MVTETGSTGDIGREYEIIRNAAHLLYGYAKAVNSSEALKEGGTIEQQLDALVLEVDGGDHDEAAELKDRIIGTFRQYENRQIDRETQSTIRDLIGKLDALARKYPEFESIDSDTGA